MRSRWSYVYFAFYLLLGIVLLFLNNFTKLILDGIINLEKDSFVKTDPASHLTEEAHANIFTKSIINLLNNY